MEKNEEIELLILETYRGFGLHPGEGLRLKTLHRRVVHQGGYTMVEFQSAVRRLVDKGLLEEAQGRDDLICLPHR